MPPQARRISVMVHPGQRASPRMAEILAGHLAGRRLHPGQRLALPGWPGLTVEEVAPLGGRVHADTEVELDAPPDTGDGPLHLAILVDASLTMGGGSSPSPYAKAARTIDGILMNGRAFLGSVGLVVQGGETRHTEPLEDPQTMSGALIHRVEPKGTFDLHEGLARSLGLLEQAPPGPLAVLVVTDGDVSLAEPVRPALDAVRAGARLFAIAAHPEGSLVEACEHAGGLAHRDPERVFAALAELAGARTDWLAPRPRAAPDPEDGAFQAVIETMEETP